MKIAFSIGTQNQTVLVVPVFTGNVPGSADDSLKKFIAKALDGETGFQGKNGQTLTLRGSDAAQKVILLGVGAAQHLNEKSARKLAAPLYKALKAEGAKQPVLDASTFSPAAIAQLADGLLHESYTFNKYKTSQSAAAPEDITLLTQQGQTASALFETLRKTTDSVFWASDLANEPANVLNPQTYEERVKSELLPLGVKVTVLETADMEKLGMNAALGVGRGSATPPRMIVLEYDGTGGAQERPLALVGKGITFDSGGISLKPGSGMDAMSLDMSGSAAVAGTIRALAAAKTPARVVGIMALAENMPDGNAQRPGDIVKSMSGKTILVGNTDAEGRLVLADAMTYVQRTFNPHTVIDLATLTGAAVAALGKEFAAVFSNDDRLFHKFNAAAQASGEKVWRMPLMETGSFTNAVRNTPLADLSNSVGGPGALTAAAFLHEFIEKDEKGADKCRWVHVDMAGPGMPDSVRKGWGVRLLDIFVRGQEAPKNRVCRKPPQASGPKI